MAGPHEGFRFANGCFWGSEKGAWRLGRRYTLHGGGLRWWMDSGPTYKRRSGMSGQEGRAGRVRSARSR